jgi:hypothetical protein
LLKKAKKGLAFFVFYAKMKMVYKTKKAKRSELGFAAPNN